MGGEQPKPLVLLAGVSLAERALQPIRHAVRLVLVSANDPRFAALGYTVVEDRHPGAGPLAGLYAAAAHLQAGALGIGRLVSVPGDTPFLPPSLARRLLEGSPDRIRVAVHAGVLHPTVAAWPLDALLDLRPRLDDPHGARSVRSALEQAGFDTVEFPPDPAAPRGDPFFNINTPADLAFAERHLLRA